MDGWQGKGGFLFLFLPLSPLSPYYYSIQRIRYLFILCLSTPELPTYLPTFHIIHIIKCKTRSLHGITSKQAKQASRKAFPHQSVSLHTCSGYLFSHTIPLRWKVLTLQIRFLGSAFEFLCSFLFYSILLSSILFYSTLFYSALFCSILLYSSLFYSLLLYPLLYSTLFYSILLYSILLYSILLYPTLLYSTLFCSLLLYSILFYSTPFYSHLLYSLLLLSSTLFYSILFYSILLYSTLSMNECFSLQTDRYLAKKTKNEFYFKSVSPVEQDRTEQNGGFEIFVF